MRARSLKVAVLCGSLLASAAEAQNSVYGVLGIGFPGRAVSTRARSTAGAMAAFDARSPLNPATVAGFRRVMIMASTGTTLRNYTALDSAVEGLSQTRSPLGVLGGPVRGTPLSFALSFNTYADRTWDLVTEDSVMIRGERIGVRDEFKSNGGITDLRGALAYRLSSMFSVGLGLHMLTGSSALSTRRDFSSVDYVTLLEKDKLSYSGLGLSAGVVTTLDQSLVLSLAVRSDEKLEVTADSASVGEVDLPWSYMAGLLVTPVPALRLSSTVIRRAWSNSATGLAAVGAANAFDTWDVSGGVELGGTPGTTRMPLSLGFRYAQLPFSPTEQQARELDFAGGSTLVFAAERVLFDFSVERILRRGGGAEEWSWFLSFAFTVRP